MWWCLLTENRAGGPRLASHGLRLHSAFTLTFILETLLHHGKIDPRTAAAAKEFVAMNQTFDQQNVVAPLASLKPANARQVNVHKQPSANLALYNLAPLGSMPQPSFLNLSTLSCRWSLQSLHQHWLTCLYADVDLQVIF